MGRILKRSPRLEESEMHLVATPSGADEDAHRTVHLVGEINEESAAIITTRLIHLSQVNSSPIRLIINTYGGSVDESMAIYDVMRSIRSEIQTIGFGKIMSAGVLLLAAGTPGQRMIGARARVMIHNGYAGFAGDVFDTRNELREFERLEEVWNRELIACSKITNDQLQKMLEDRKNAYVDAKGAVKYGLVDRILGS